MGGNGRVGNSLDKAIREQASPLYFSFSIGFFSTEKLGFTLFGPSPILSLGNYEAGQGLRTIYGMQQLVDERSDHLQVDV